MPPRFFQSYTQEQLSHALIPVSQRYNPKNLTEQQINNRARRWARQMFQWIYQKKITDWTLLTDLPLMVREWAQSELPLLRLKAASCSLSLDATHKFLWQLEDHKTIESVMIPATKPTDTSFTEGMRFRGSPHPTHITRRTACISSQVGCAMKCSFCLTGIQGIDRNLSTAEIVAQVHELSLQYPLTNIVFMGMGEPLNNLDQVVQACQIFLDQDGFHFSKRKITISTSGIVPKINLLGQKLQVSLAISLNATTDSVRSEIMPVNNTWNIQTLLNACRQYPTGAHRRITFEYVLLAGINDSPEDATRLAALVKTIPHKVNLIPFNEHPGSHFKRPSDKTVKAFQNLLLASQITTTVRVSRGQDILAACGQLRSSKGSARGSDRHSDFKCTS